MSGTLPFWMEIKRESTSYDAADPITTPQEARETIDFFPHDLDELMRGHPHPMRILEKLQAYATILAAELDKGDS